jgi:serine protease Do
VEEGQDFEGDDAPPFRTPPPPDDRLWRHPSELGRPAPPPPGRRGTWPIALVSGVTGAVLTIGVLAVTGVLAQRSGPREVVVREASRVASARFDAGPPVPDVARIASEVEPTIVRLDITGDEDGVGSGVLFRTDGHVLTNAHVVDDAKQVVAVLASGRSIPAQVVGMDAASDIAVLKLDAPGPFPTAVFGTTDGMAIGEPAIAIGSPLGGPSVTVGVVSALGREVASKDGAVLLDMIQTDATLAAGSSGGALLDADGTLIGITNTAGGDSDLGFATPVDVARAAAEDLLSMGRVRIAWFGVKGAVAADGGGVVVAATNAGGPAELAGLRGGDVIRRVDTRPIGSMTSLRTTLRRHHPGDHVTVVYDRDGQRRTAVVTLGEHP